MYLINGKTVQSINIGHINALVILVNGVQRIVR